MALQVNGKTALVTGGGSGVCLEFTRLLLSKGCNVVIADLALSDLAKATVDDKNGKARALYVKTDVADWKQLEAAFDFAVAKFGSLEIVCPGAGIFEPKWSNFWHPNKENTSSSTFATLELNITHPIRATQLAIHHFKRQSPSKTHGVVVLISSIAAQMPLLPTPLYASSKAAISAFTRCMGALEPTENIRVVAVAPGIVDTPIWTEDKRVMVEEGVDAWVPVGKVAQTMLELIEDKENAGGTVLEVGCDAVRRVEGLNDPGPSGRGFEVSNIGGLFAKVSEDVAANFGK